MAKLFMIVSVTFACGVPLGMFAGMAAVNKVSPLYAAPLGFVLMLGIILGAYIIIETRP